MVNKQTERSRVCVLADHATILLGSNLGQVVYSHCLPSLLSSKKLGVQKRVFGLDRFNGLTD